MIIVWNNCHGQTYGFLSLDAYKKFAVETEGRGRTSWDDEVHDIGDGGEATEENRINMYDFNYANT